jgi:uncharacterized protein (TIGR02246 family)
LCAQKNFEQWNNALRARDFAKASSLYSATDLSFLPTMSSEFIRDAPSTQRYFADFIQRLPEGKITDDYVVRVEDDAYLHSGMYTFMTGPEQRRTPVQARFTYMWQQVSGTWKIIHHHSSVVPGSVIKHDLYDVAHENFNKWNQFLQDKDYERVASLYSEDDLSFLPTISPKFIRDTAQTQEYFMEFLKKLPFGTITSDNVQSYGPDAYLHTGLYTFMVGPETDRQPVQARFSYMWRKINGDWKIVHHHSSAQVFHCVMIYTRICGKCVQVPSHHFKHEIHRVFIKFRSYVLHANMHILG